MGSACERAFQIALIVLVFLRKIYTIRTGRIDVAGLLRIAHRQELRGKAGLLEGFGHHNRYGLAYIVHIGQHLLGRLACLALRRITQKRSASDDGDHTWQTKRRRVVNRGHSAFRDSGAHKEAFGHIVDVVLCRISRRTSYFQRAFGPRHRVPQNTLRHAVQRAWLW